ncbi:glutathione S-transferase family protein [Iningainema tapete]|uniref:Glutathione S-transferase family protein n=1 Tax=Iningainema tapete BLCC-T55 TaxID=2748662 RepID=A0A8J6XCW3_9CYAN|nr:glutathione S-transferase family protein [Iningainema tapete]MBD2770695.1 glutathione S-transferase family protein [Iningainema tapete BLCC-T55]
MSNTTSILFYANRNCPYAQRSWLTLLELKVDFEYQEIELGKDNKTDWFLELNPNGTVPVIKHGDTVIYESLVVNEYLCEVFGDDKVNLMPNDPAGRSRARILINRCDSKFVKLSYSYLSHKRTAEEDSVVKDNQLRTQLEDELRFLDNAISSTGGPYFMGKTVSLVDTAYMPFFERMSVALAHWKDFDIKNLSLPHLNTWLEVMSNREAYQKTRMSLERIVELYSRFLNVDYFKRVGIAQ